MSHLRSGTLNTAGERIALRELASGQARAAQELDTAHARRTGAGGTGYGRERAGEARARCACVLRA